MFFFEKKNQKTFESLRALVPSPRQPTKVFCFFFSKKKTLPAYRAFVPAGTKVIDSLWNSFKIPSSATDVVLENR
jgi:hypothetical protein